MNESTAPHETGTHLGKSSRKIPTGQRTLFIIGIFVAILGVFGSLFFSNTIKKFFWEVRTKLVIEVVHEQGKHVLQKNDIPDWQNTEAITRMELFAKETREYIPNVVAVKIFTTDGTLAWTNLQNVKAGYKKQGIETELGEIIDRGQLIKEAGDAAKQELLSEELLEIWTVLKTPEGEILGFVELYFDSSDISGFANKIKYSIWGVIAVMLYIVLFLIHLAFRKQDDLIVHQARELSNVIERSPIGIYTVTKKGVIETFNPKMAEISGVKDAGELIGKNVFEMESYKEAGLDKLITEGLAGIAFEKELEITSRQGGGKKTYRHYHGVPLKDARGDISHLLLMVEDITEQKILQSKAEEYAKGLELKIQERTKELRTRIADLEQFERVTVGRELRMTELKQEVEKMRIKLESLGVAPDKTVL